MKSFSSLTLVENLKTKVFKDGWMVGFLVLIGLINVFSIVWSLTHIHRTQIQVPIRYTSLANFDQLAPWYQLYSIAAISLLVLIINLILATLTYSKSRLLSIFVIMITLMVAIYSAAVAIGFTAINYGAV